MQQKCEKWKTTLDSHINHAFRKMKMRKSIRIDSKIDDLIKNPNKLKKAKQPNDNLIHKLELQISELLIKEGVSKANQFCKYCDQSSILPLHHLWKLTNKLWPKKASSLPIAKFNHRRRLVTSPNDIMQVLLKEFKDRLRQR